MKVTAIVGITHTKIPELSVSLRNYLYEELAYRVPGAHFMPSVRRGRWDGYKRFFQPITTSFLTGLLPHVTELLAKRDCTLIPDYEKLPELKPRIGELPQLVTVRDYQDPIIEMAIEIKRGIIRAAVNCLAGSTEIQVYRAGITRKMTLEKLVNRFNGEPITWAKKKPRRPSQRRWDPRIITYIRVRMSDRFIRLAPLTAAYKGEIKPVFRIVLENGKSIDASMDHRFLTLRRWTRVMTLDVGDLICVEALRIKGPVKSQRRRNWVIGTRKFHPFKTGHRYRLVVEAHLNNMSFGKFVQRIRAGQLDGLKFLDPKKFEIHHKDRNILNDRFSNLKVYKRDGNHQRMHGIQDGWKNFTRKTEFAKIVEIRYLGMVQTYDLEVKKFHNFIANGIVTHNSGKTEIALEIIRRLRLTTLYLVPSKELFDQMMDAAQERLPGMDIGMIKAGTFEPGLLTIAMNQSVIKAYPDAEKVNRGEIQLTESGKAMKAWIKNDVECVIADEVHHSAADKWARAFTEAKHAQYRYGLSATPHGMGDIRDTMLTGLTGKMFGRITTKELVERGLSVKTFVTFIKYKHTGGGLSHYTGMHYQTIIEEGVAENKDRIDALIATLQKHLDAKHRIVAMVDTIKAGEYLMERMDEHGVKVQSLYGPHKNRRAILKRFKSAEYPVLVTTLLKEGVNIPEIDVIVNLGAKSSATRTIQQAGRILRTREGKEVGQIYDFIDPEHDLLLAASRKRYKAYKEEGFEVNLLDVTGGS